MSVLIRNTEEKDAEKIAELEKICFSQPWTAQGIMDTINSGQSIFLSAEVDGEIAGYVGATYAADEAEITDIAVFPGFRRRGIAEKLMEKLFVEASMRGVVAVFLDVRATNEAAILLYKKAGYEFCGIRKRFYNLPVEDAYIFRRDLNL